MKMRKYLNEYCVGCGLCEACGTATCETDEKGFMHPFKGDEDWLKKVCPSSGIQQQCMDFQNIWGRTKEVYYGWTSNRSIRQVASSGGVITEIASWMLESKRADAVLHVCADPQDPTKTICCESTSREELTSRSGSRYAISHPLKDISLIDVSKRYVFIGKPCDVVALRNYMKINEKLRKGIVLILSFFCAGVPSIYAQDNLLKHLQCSKEELVSLKYRGDGWPGYTTAVDKHGKIYQTDYATSWGKILGRDIMKMCRFCLDGIGEMADISCGDAWYLTPDKKPDFTEAEGRNVIFARTDIGKNLLDAIIKDGGLQVTPTTVDDLKYIQTYQWDRRATMVDKMLAMRLFGKSFPKYELGNLLKYSKTVPIKRHYAIFKGTIKRILCRKIN